MALNSVCATPLWNASISWDTEDPYVTKCFQHLILVLGTCSVLWVIAPFEFIKICRKPKVHSGWSKLGISKMVLNGIILILSTIDLATGVYTYMDTDNAGLDTIIATTSYFITIVLTIIITLMCKERGLRVSLALPSFWMASTLATLISIYGDIQEFRHNDWTTYVSLIDDSLVFIISLISLLLSTIADKPPPLSYMESRDQCPLEGASLPSRLTFTWILRLLLKSVQNSLHQDFLTPLCPDLKSSNMMRCFHEACESRDREQRISSEDMESLVHERTSIESQDGSRANFSYNYSYPEGKSLFIILLKISKNFLVVASFLEVVYTLLYFLPVCILSLLLDKEKERHEWHNYLYASTLFIALLFSAFADSQRKYYGIMAALRIKSAVMNAVFEKALKVSNNQSKDAKQLITVESNSIFQMVCMLNEVWGSPIRLLIGVYLLFTYLGPSCFVGISSALILIPVNLIVEQGTSYYQDKYVDRKNERINILTECLKGLKVLKFYAWEEVFLKKILSIRREELSELRKSTFLRMTFKFIFLSGISMVLLVTFISFTFMGNSMDSKTVFVSLFLTYLLRSPFRSLIHLLSHFIQGLASIKRIQHFLEARELARITASEELNGNSVLLTNASFSWEGADIPCLKSLNLRIPKGDLVAVVGEPKSGKSSLLRALLGELRVTEGSASIQGELAFVGDEAWIQNTTLEKNILFLRPKVEKIYRKTLEACALIADIDTLPAGEETEIGQMGVHLSKNQKIKVDLARVVYQDAQIYLLDNPLKNLETPLMEHLYHRIIGRSGLLKEKTRLFTTSSEDFLPLVDHIVFIKDGRITEQGTYTQLQAKQGHFAEFLRNSQSRQATAKASHHSDIQEPNLLNNNTFQKQGDLWYSTAVIPAKLESEQFITDDAVVAPKGFWYKLTDFFKTQGTYLTMIAVLFSGLACACEVASGVWLSMWTDGNGIGQKSDRNLLIYSGFIASQVFLTILCGITIFAISTRATEKLHNWLLSRIIRSSQTAFEMTPIPKIIHSFNTDFHYADEKIPETFYIWLIATFRVPASLVVIYVVSPFLGVISIPLVFGFLMIQKLYLSAWQQLQHLTSATSCPLSNLVNDSLQGASNIRATQSFSHFFGRFHLKLDTHNNCSLLYFLASRWLNSSVDILTAFLVLITTTMALYDCEIGTGYIGLTIVYSMQLGEILTTMVYMCSMLSSDLTALERIKSFFQMKQEAEWEDPSNRPPSSWPEAGEIQIQSLSTAYSEDMNPVLNDINLTINPGEKVALIGKEESGISTFLYTLFRLTEPVHGQILIDKVDVSRIGLKDLRSRLGFIPQESLTFRGTIRENLDPKEFYKDDELWSAIEMANLKERISTLDSSLDENMSPDDKYLLSLARCFLKQPKIVVIDETESPDSRGRNLFPDSTVLSFCDQPLPDFNGRLLKLLGGQLVDEGYPFQ